MTLVNLITHIDKAARGHRLTVVLYKNIDRELNEKVLKRERKYTDEQIIIVITVNSKIGQLSF